MMYLRPILSESDPKIIKKGVPISRAMEMIKLLCTN